MLKQARAAHNGKQQTVPDNEDLANSRIGLAYTILERGGERAAREVCGKVKLKRLLAKF